MGQFFLNEGCSSMVAYGVEPPVALDRGELSGCFTDGYYGNKAGIAPDILSPSYRQRLSLGEYKVIASIENGIAQLK